MTYIPNAGAVTDVQFLAADVTNGNTFTLPYPAGFSQNSFNAGLAVPGGSYIVLNDASKVVEGAGGVAFAFGASITVTNNTGQTIKAGTKVRAFLNQVDNNDAIDLCFPLDLAAITANGDVVSAFRPGVDGYIENLEFIASKPATTAGKAASLSAKINAAAVTGGAVALTSANVTPLGARVAGSQVTGSNRITKADSLTITAAGVTAFVEGAGSLHVRIRADTL